MLKNDCVQTADPGISSHNVFNGLCSLAFPPAHTNCLVEMHPLFEIMHTLWTVCTALFKSHVQAAGLKGKSLTLSFRHVSDQMIAFLFDF